MTNVHIQPQTIETAIETGTYLVSGDRPMQDVISITELDNGVTILGMYDGQGRHGLQYAQSTASVLNKALLEFEPEAGSDEPLNVQYAVHIGTKVTGKLSNYAGFGGWLGDTTITVAAAHRNLVSTVQLGSGGVVFVPADRRSPASRLTPAHHTYSPAEVARAKATGAPSDKVGYSATEGGVASLQVTHAAGDSDAPFAGREPEISHFAVTEPGSLVIATDGLWAPTATDEVDSRIRDPLADFLDTYDRLDAFVPEVWQGRKAAFLARLGNTAWGDGTSVITVEYR